MFLYLVTVSQSRVRPRIRKTKELDPLELAKYWHVPKEGKHFMKPVYATSLPTPKENYEPNPVGQRLFGPLELSKCVYAPKKHKHFKKPGVYLTTNHRPFRKLVYETSRTHPRPTPFSKNNFQSFTTLPKMYEDKIGSKRVYTTFPSKTKWPSATHFPWNQNETSFTF